MRAVRLLALVPVVLLTGCGVAGTQFHPGVAAQVGDETITTRHVDQVTADYCAGLEKVAKGQPAEQQASQATPLRYLSHAFASSLITKAAAEQLAEQYDVEPTPDYQVQMAQLEPELAKLDEDEKDAVREVLGADAYTSNVLTRIGEQVLEDQGNTDASDDDNAAAGQQALSAWIADHDVDINPRYGIELGNQDQVDTDLSYAVSSTAKSGTASEVDPDYTDGLADDLVCLG